MAGFKNDLTSGAPSGNCSLGRASLVLFTSNRDDTLHSPLGTSALLFPAAPGVIPTCTLNRGALLSFPKNEEPQGRVLSRAHVFHTKPRGKH